ncbi:hypothetical protein R3W88_022433 [Solanum pinnatisectum]|uniref:Tryptophan synthase beta chain-like PALP domain-containing protein n=1 Tax=Solanum pinnatisectum TaxID=50273 RepID=A0AAV9LUK7_9SOLN|nr:hypothetical protein R3W88_022433 [Solanum pinnatisectum]
MEPNHPTSSNDYAADISSIRQAQVRIDPFAHKTPVLTLETLDSIAGRKLYFKCECFQKGGAFKFRGACNAIYSLDDDHAAKGVVTHSSGQGTISLELLEQASEIDTLIVPISGGGLISGVVLAAKAIKPAIHIFAAEPMGANDAFQLKINGRIIKLSEVNTISDGLRAFLGDLTWPIVRDLMDDVIVVDDEEIIQAMRLGAIGLAAVLSNSFKTNPAYSECNNIGIVISGGNVDLGVLSNNVNKRETL